MTTVKKRNYKSRNKVISKIFYLLLTILEIQYSYKNYFIYLLPQ